MYWLLPAIRAESAETSETGMVRNKGGMQDRDVDTESVFEMRDREREETE